MVKTFAKVALSAAVASLSMTALSQEVEFGLEEVVVTAQKRTESLQDVPISVTAISGEQIENASIRSFRAGRLCAELLSQRERGEYHHLYARHFDWRQPVV